MLALVVLLCPFCGAPETARLDLDGQRSLVFGCQFTPQVDPNLTEAEVEDFLKNRFSGTGEAYFRRTCDRLHLFVTRGEAGRVLSHGVTTVAPKP